MGLQSSLLMAAFAEGAIPLAVLQQQQQKQRSSLYKALQSPKCLSSPQSESESIFPYRHRKEEENAESMQGTIRRT
jgi:hypothetical protein